MTSVERIQQYEKLDQEAPEHTNFPIPSGWPCKGKIEFQNVTMKYSKTHTRKALTDIQFEIDSKEKVGSLLYISTYGTKH